MGRRSLTFGNCFTSPDSHSLSASSTAHPSTGHASQKTPPRQKYRQSTTGDNIDSERGVRRSAPFISASASYIRRRAATLGSIAVGPAPRLMPAHTHVQLIAATTPRNISAAAGRPDGPRTPPPRLMHVSCRAALPSTPRRRIAGHTHSGARATEKSCRGVWWLDRVRRSVNQSRGKTPMSFRKPKGGRC